MDLLGNFIEQSYFYAIILCLGAISGIFSERSGTINIGIEGMMSMGGAGYATGAYILFHLAPKQTSGLWQIPLFLLAALSGVLFALLHGFATIKLKSEHTISGVALNILAIGIAIAIFHGFGNAQKTFNSNINELGLYYGTDAGTGGVEKLVSLKTFLFIGLVIFAWIMLNKTSWGLRFKAVGENPQAVDVAGVNVFKLKWQGIILSGVFAGIAGGIFAQGYRGSFKGSTGGLGFLALAVMIMAHWNVGYAVLSAFFFSIFQYIGVKAVTTEFGILTEKLFNKNLGEYGDLFRAIPYFITLIMLISFSKLSPGPAAAGINYDKSRR